ncbi:MAG: hypothetical protein NTX03_06080 [Bacteroidetes bacterium]|nr:hypothetical protein [Bacteroidota bacterium]
MSKKEAVVFILPRGEAIRNFVESGVSDLVRNKYELVFISVFPNEAFKEILKTKCDFLYEIDASKDPYIVSVLRDQIDVIHGRWLWSGSAKNRWKLRDSEAKTYRQRGIRFLKKAIAYLFASRHIIEFISSIEQSLSQTIFVNKKYKSILVKHGPVLVFNTSHIHNKNSLKVINAAVSIGIKTVTFLFSWDNLTSQGRITPRYTHYISWNESIKADLMSIYPFVKNDQISVTGTTQFDFHFKKENYWSKEVYCKYIGADPNRPIVLYTTGMMNLQPGEEAIVLRVADFLATLPDKPQLVVRVYPKDVSGRYEEIKKQRTDIIFPHIPWEAKFATPLPEDTLLWTNMLLHCHLGINVASTVTLELCMFDKPVINIGFNPPGKDIRPLIFADYYQWEHYKPITDSGAAYIAYSEEQMQNDLINALNNPLEKQQNRKKLIEDFFDGMLDGNANERMAEVINKL